MSVLIKDMEKPEFCYAVIDGEIENCPFVNTDADCVLLLKKGICEETWAGQYSKCPLIEAPEPCEDTVSRQAAIKAIMSVPDGNWRSVRYANEIKKLSSAQPDLSSYSDKLWRSAYERGKRDAQPDIIRCRDCYWWTKQEDSLQGRCDRYGTYPTGYWYCAAARERREE